MRRPFDYPDPLSYVDVENILRALRGMKDRQKLIHELNSGERPKYKSPDFKNLSMIEETLTQVDNDREYVIRKGKVLEKFKEEFHERYKHHRLYTDVLELLIRGADPYSIIENVIAINDDLWRQHSELMMRSPIPLPKKD
jgi:hypothetical protein